MKAPRVGMSASCSRLYEPKLNGITRARLAWLPAATGLHLRRRTLRRAIETEDATVIRIGVQKRFAASLSFRVPAARCRARSSRALFRFAGPMRCGRCSPTPGWTRSLSALSMSPCTFATSMTTGSPFSAIRALRRPIWPDSTPLRKAVSVGSRRASTTWRAGLPALSPRLSTPIPAGHEQRCPAICCLRGTTASVLHRSYCFLHALALAV